VFSLALRGLASRKLRAALTALAIMLGVAMVAGTFMLKGSVDKAFDDIFAEANAGIDVTIQPKSAFDTGFDLPASAAPRSTRCRGSGGSAPASRSAAPASRCSRSLKPRRSPARSASSTTSTSRRPAGSRRTSCRRG
jgi:putative ABC transport system permease protein